MELRTNGVAGAIVGMATAIAHAESVSPRWADRAGELLRRFVAERVAPFSSPDLRAYADRIGFERPPTNWAWGGVINSAARNGLIKKCGGENYGNETMHTRVVTLWRPA